MYVSTFSYGDEFYGHLNNEIVDTSDRNKVSLKGGWLLP